MRTSGLHINLFLIFFSSAIFAQTTNEGKLYVSENTLFSVVEAFDNRETAAFYNDGTTFIYNHLNNNGVFDYFLETGTIQFIGAHDQMISGLEPSSLYNALFKNSGTNKQFLLAGSIDINGTANFLNGIIDNSNFGGTLTFGKSANHKNTSDYSFVNGSVHKFGDEAFVFPIGKNSLYRPSAISASALSSLHTESEYFLKNSDEIHRQELRAGGIEKINDTEYWTFTKNDEESALFVTLTYNENTTPPLFLSAADKELLIIVRWDDDSNMWVNEDGVIDAVNKTITTATKKDGVFTFGILKEEVLNPGNLVIYNAVTPNGDGINDYFLIDFPQDGSVGNLHVTIFNRWGLKVFESKNYGMNDDVFRGYSQSGKNIDGREQLPTGTYFYILEYELNKNGEKNNHRKAGYLYLSGN